MVSTRSSRGARTAGNRAAEEAIRSGGNYKLRQLLRGTKPRTRAGRKPVGGGGGAAKALDACGAKVARLERTIAHLKAQVKGGHTTAVKRRQRVTNDFRTSDLYDTWHMMPFDPNPVGRGYIMHPAEQNLRNTRYAEMKYAMEIAKTNANTRNAAKKRAAYNAKRAAGK